MRNTLRFLGTLLLLVPLCAQEPAKPATEAAKPAEQEKPAEAAKPAEPPAPAPEAASTEGWIRGSLEIGYRWIPNIDGNFNAYRSVVNLGEGPKLFDADFTLRDPARRLFDRADVKATSWGGDPYNTLRVDMRREGSYRFSADYRNIAYFNFLPSYANPGLNQGVLLDQNAFDTAIRNTNVQLDLLPNKWITPYLGFGRNTQFGRGITVFHTDRNEYAVASLYSDQTNNYRAGARLELGRYHVTVEQGGTTFKDDQGASDALPNPGNLAGLFLGKQLPLNQLSELYRVRGDSIYTKALVAGTPYSWMSVTGEFVYAKPSTDIQYTQSSAGNFYLNSILQFYSTGQDVLTGDANLPHVSGNLSVELRPWPRLRIVEYWMTDRFHNASNALLAENLLLASGSRFTANQLSTDRMVLNYNQQEVDAFYDLTSRLTLRGGYRYVWGDTDVRAPILIGLSLESASLSRHVGIAGVTYRAGKKLRVMADAEGSSSSRTFFRASLHDYQKARIRGTYEFSPAWHFTGDFSVLNNSNPDRSVKLDFASKIESASIYWTPQGGKLVNVLVDYTRSAVRSNVLYLIPQVLQPDTSIYRENAHTGTAVVGIKWFSFGGSLFRSSGSRPTRYYQPLARVSVPVYKHVQWNAEWRWYSLSERFLALEGFRSNQLMTSLRFTR